MGKNKNQVNKNKMKKYNYEKKIKIKNDYKGLQEILHLKINKHVENIAMFDYDDNNPMPHEPVLLENKLCNISSNLQNNNTIDAYDNREDVRVEKKQVVINLMSDFIKGIGGEWPNKTNVYCYWCCHPFYNIPCGIPEKYENGIFHLSNCFCSFNCTASYIFKTNCDKKWEKYTLLNLLYRKIYNKKDKIELALDKKLLNIFGGYMDIDEFRKNLDIIDKKYNILIPPIVSIIPKVEILKNNCVVNDFNNFNNFDMSEHSQKPKKINTLANYMNITYN